MNEEEKAIIFQQKIDNSTRLVGKEMWINSDFYEIRGFIERRHNDLWIEIGHALVMADNKETARIGDLLIGTRDGQYTLYDENRPKPGNIQQAARFRGKGIGTKTMKLILARLKAHGIKQVYGLIVDADDKTRAKNFWQKIGFEITDNQISKNLYSQ
jgi:GNAT superfamily N-acetyltransferase